MHQQIGALVLAKTKGEARVLGDKVFEQLTENERPFDYYKTLQTYKAKSEKGKELIKQRIDWTKSTFLESLELIRQVLDKHTDKELWNDKYPDELTKDEKFRFDLFGHKCWHAGEYAGTDTWLFDPDGEGIRTPHHLEDVLTKWKCLWEKYPDTKKENEGKDVWIVIADVHH